MWGFLREDWRYYAALALIVLAVALLFASTHHARAHMHDRPDLDDWLRTLYSSRSPCCDGSDAETMADLNWMTASKEEACQASEPRFAPEHGEAPFHFCVLLEKPQHLLKAGEEKWGWYQVQDDAIVCAMDGNACKPIGNRAGPALLWMYWAASGRPFIRCFLPGTLG